VVGLAVHVGGYALRSSVTTEPLELMADLLYALGYALWTGVVVIVFVQVFPEAKRRQFKQALDAYEAAKREQVRAGTDQASGEDAAPTARSPVGHHGRSLPAHISAQLAPKAPAVRSRRDQPGRGGATWPTWVRGG
jgi:hypothetical protein